LNKEYEYLRMPANDPIGDDYRNKRHGGSNLA
jgi:hypothetical protein